MPPARSSSLAGPLRRAPRSSRLAFACLAAVVATLYQTTPVGAQEEEPPSILLIITDDQRWDTLWAMPEVQRSLVERGVTFSEAFTTSSLCCPSRASILTGQYPHTTGVYRQGLPHGGFKSFDDRSTIATALRAGGYRTGLFGKYLDSYQSDALAGYVPPGWDRWVAFVHSQYFGYTLTVDGTIERFGAAVEDYSTGPRTSSSPPTDPCSRSTRRRRRTPPRPRRRKTGDFSPSSPRGGRRRSTSRTSRTSRRTCAR